ncbi:MAG TPA: hypothetical protein VHB68_08085 [Steroidobacteraceae bacterium]|nr:hypothetical protein [Steroidobacteraceae bacterium]
MNPLRSSTLHSGQAAQTEPTKPVPQEEPAHDVPAYPEQDPPPGEEKAQMAMPPEQGDLDDDLDPWTPHSPPDTGKERVIFEESAIA